MNKESELPLTVLNTLQDCLPNSLGLVDLHEPCLEGNEWIYVKDCIDSGWVSSVGEYVSKFEIELAKYTGVNKAVAVASGTAALHIALKICGVLPGDEVLVPALTFVATANAVAYCGASPHFVDCEEYTLGVDPQKLDSYLRLTTSQISSAAVNKNTGKKISALIVVHAMGHPADLDRLREVCAIHHITLIEDAAESIGSFYRDKHTGNWGRVATLSFNGNKTITTGGGGAILTNDEELAALAKHLTTTAKRPHAFKFFHDEIGYNYRLPNINAALGCAQLESLPDLLRRKRSLAEKYKTAFASLEGIRFFKEPGFAQSNYWLNTLVLDNDLASLRDDVLESTNQANIRTRPVWEPLHTLPMYKDCQRMDLSCATNLSSRLINIPSSPTLSP